MLRFRVSGPARLWKLEPSVKERAKGVQEWRERGATLLGQESQVWGGRRVEFGDMDGDPGCGVCLRHNNTIHWAQTWVLTPL